MLVKNILAAEQLTTLVTGLHRVEHIDTVLLYNLGITAWMVLSGRLTFCKRVAEENRTTAYKALLPFRHQKDPWSIRGNFF
jgi:hypothetical protein